jgi:hypothetical protein
MGDIDTRRSEFETPDGAAIRTEETAPAGAKISTWAGN